MHVAKHVQELSSVPKETLEAITWKNAARFFGVDVGARMTSQSSASAAE
jgi:hypothetical protein